MLKKLNICIYDKILIFFCLIHIFFWTVLPTCLRFCLPMDALESVTWGQHFALGYDKNPFLVGWLAKLATKISGENGWAIYMLGQLSAVICFIAIYNLGRKFVAPIYALIAALVLDCITMYNIDAIDFGDNALTLSLWALIILFFYKAAANQKLLDWLCCGFFAAFAAMTKYSVVVLFAPMLIFLLFDSNARASFKNKSFYYAAILFLLIVTPHFIWLYFHNFITIKYAFFRTYAHKANYNFWQNLKTTYDFSLSLVLSSLLPLLLCFGFFFGKKKQENNIATKQSINTSKWKFLLLLGFGPWLCTILLSLIFSFNLHLGWGTPFLSLIPLTLVAFLQPAITKQKFKYFIITLFSIICLAFVTYIYVTEYYASNSSANYPAKKIAKKLTQIWHNKYHTQLKYVIGRMWEASVIGFYSQDKPEVFMSGDNEIAFWIDKKDVYRRGAIIVYNSKERVEFNNLRVKYKNLTNIKIMRFKIIRSKNDFVVLYVAFLPPRDNFKHK